MTMLPNCSIARKLAEDLMKKSLKERLPKQFSCVLPSQTSSFARLSAFAFGRGKAQRWPRYALSLYIFMAA
jgi:hypothetical protein